MRNIYTILTTLLLLIIVFNGYSQKLGACGESLPSVQERQEIKKAFLDWKAQRTTNENEDIKFTIPVVFHYITEFESAPETSIIESTLEELNDGFANDGSFITPNGVDSQIRFCLASTSPDGGVTNGINLISSTYGGFDYDLETEKLLHHISWNTNRYLNIYVTDEIRSENKFCTVFSGKNGWKRSPLGGFSIQGTGVVIQGLEASVLIHEIGHYFGLLHTFENFISSPCKNDDCFADGDMICDTPPDKSVFESCEDNSCSTDTLSNFSNYNFYTDTLDMGTNFMDYNGCPTEFSKGQTERMLFVIDNLYPELPIENNSDNKCQKPCEELEAVGIEINKKLIITNTPIALSATGQSYNQYNWYIFKSKGTWIEQPNEPIVSTDSSFIFQFNTKGWYTVYLKAWNDSELCYTTFSRDVLVTCSVDARFSPDKRRIASKKPDSLFTDSVTFVNYSDGATDYDWTIKHTNLIKNGPTLPDYKSTDVDLTYLFEEPGVYFIDLVASNSTCTDQTNTFRLMVHDPTMDGSPIINVISCYNQDSIQLDLTIYNYGFDTINIGTPISFYQGNPQLANGSRYLETQYLPEIVYGFEELIGFSQKDFTFYFQADYANIDSVYVVFNDPGTEIFPIEFPPGDENILSFNSQYPKSSITELDYTNNFNYINPLWTEPLKDTVACLGALLKFSSQACWDSLSWDSNEQGYLGSTSTIEYTALSNDKIVLSLITNNGIIPYDSFLVTVNIPKLDILENVFRIKKGQSTQLYVEYDPTDSISWNPSSSLDNPYIGSPNASPSISTLYNITVTDRLGCRSMGKITVLVTSPGYIPNLFSPNGDGRNDRLLIYGIEGVAELNFRIYNRAGNEVYHSNNTELMITKGWDGNWEGQRQPSGAYYWKVSGKYVDGEKLKLNDEEAGVIHLIR